MAPSLDGAVSRRQVAIVSNSDDNAQDSSEGGQVSEVSTLEGADEPIQPDQAVAGAPDAESGDVQEGETGPNARTGKDAGDPPS